MKNSILQKILNEGIYKGIAAKSWTRGDRGLGSKLHRV
jgi:hypothetical protein